MKNHILDTVHQVGSVLGIQKVPPVNYLEKLIYFIVLDFFNPLDGLSGWVKVPKDGKVKKGWKSIFLAFNQDKLMTFNSQDDFLKDKPGTIICEISYVIFLSNKIDVKFLLLALYHKMN